MTGDAEGAMAQGFSQQRDVGGRAGPFSAPRAKTRAPCLPRMESFYGLPRPGSSHDASAQPKQVAGSLINWFSHIAYNHCGAACVGPAARAVAKHPIPERMPERADPRILLKECGLPTFQAWMLALLRRW